MDLLRTFLTEWLSSFISSVSIVDLIVKLAMILAWILVAYIIHFVAKLIVFSLKRANKKSLVKRQKTIAALVVSLITYAFWFVIVMMILLELGIDLAPVLASAGILGFAIGFGAQELIKDLISGFFILFEQSFNVGDVIQIGDFKGTVLEIGIRKTKLVNWKNEIRLVNNGDIRVITQFSMSDSVGVVEFHVSPYTDLSIFYSEPFIEILERYNDKPFITEGPKFIGIVENGLHVLTLRVTFKTENNKQFSLERELKRDILMFLNNKNK